MSINPLLLENSHNLRRIAKRYHSIPPKYELDTTQCIVDNYLDKSMVICRKEINIKTQEAKKQYVIRKPRVMSVMQNQKQPRQLSPESEQVSKTQDLILKFLGLSQGRTKHECWQMATTHANKLRDLFDLEKHHQSNANLLNYSPVYLHIKLSVRITHQLQCDLIQFMINTNFSMKCRRTHFLKDCSYLLQVQDQLTLTNDKGIIKYSLELQWKQIVFWKYVKQKTIAFGFVVDGNKFKWFHAEPQELDKLKQILSTYVTFAPIHDYYEFNKQIGVGKCSQIYNVLSKVDNKEYASKCIPKQYIDMNRSSAHSLESLYNELTILCSLSHQNFLKFHEFYESESSYFLVTEINSGVTLDQYIQKLHRPMSLTLVKSIIYECLLSLQYLHSQNIIHRDLNPCNIMITIAGKDTLKEIKLLDFGSATTKANFNQPYNCGTPGYIAPELFNQENPLYDPKCDIFSLGAIFYKCLMSQDLFQGTSRIQIQRANETCNMNLANIIFEKVPRGIFDLISKMLDKDPKYRLSTHEALNHRVFMEQLSSGLFATISQTFQVQTKSSMFTQQYKTIDIMKPDDKYDECFNFELPPITEIPIMDNVKGGMISLNTEENEVYFKQFQ